MATPPTESRDELLAEARDVAARLGKRTLSRAEFERESGVSDRQVTKHFDSWNDFVQAAGLEPYVQNVRLGDEDLLRAMRDAYMDAGGVVPVRRFRRYFKHSESILAKRWGSFRGAQVRLREWLEENEPSFPYLDALPAAAAARVGQPMAETEPELAPATTSWPAQQGDLYGEFINFRSLQHAPVNEQGVVFLFGMVAHDLGFVIERVQTGYPDCEAKRRVKGGRGYERVRIEFEFRSSNFNHQPEGCDLVVCWEHNWLECPIEVLELRSAIRSLSDEPR